ncbi:uncharacterized protein LOC6580240 [Drosophila mojavensis]|uniref:Uncharacterized protein n=1 Tax=Drosophila mojavensis TaxID=7230 RepID=B4KNP4_DROMO|nr:uncharacterized protein LOC6580240 [Drosophila mojavensis]EDW10029.2 uncharacterized protein Dmoj_GI16969 [Drosophila mojavensis]
MCKRGTMLKTYIVALIVHAAFAAPATIVPRIQSDNGFQLEPQDDQYTLSIRHPDGKSWREETVQLTPAGVPEVKGIINQAFDDRGATLLVTYEAGPNGYVAKYRYKSNSQPERPIYGILLSSTLLKVAAG